jgi:hypothetical protein
MRKHTKNALRLKSARSYKNEQRLDHALRGYQLANCNYIVVERDSRVIPIFEGRSMMQWQIVEAQERLFLVA